MNGNKDSEEESPGRPQKPGEEGAAAPKPREISREEVDHQQPQDPDPDDPVSP
ncbi:MAG: hypothetical protein ABWY05_17810 [Noviherbaspirillum sp.]